MTSETDVLIAGGGPTGMMAALCLAERGVRFRIVDKNPTRSDKSRALVVHARTLELFQRLGFAEELAARGRPITRVQWHIGDRAPFGIDLKDGGVDDTPYPFFLFVSQADTESCLDEALKSRGLSVERPVELASFTQDADGVTAQLQHDGSTETLRARYLIGADGAHSIVRKTAGFQFEGAPYPQDFVLADAQVEWGEPGDAFRLFLNPHGMLLTFPMKEEGRYRVIVSETGARTEGDPTLADVQAMVSRIANVSLRLYEPHWLARFHLHHRGVDRYSAGRVFVAGDAAHIHSPVGGQGMNTGIQDAANLAWKLADVLQGRAGSALLDSYNAERLPVGHRLLQVTDRMFSVAATENPFVIGLRDFLMPHVVPLATASRARRGKIFRFASQLGIRYEDSAIVQSHGTGWNGGPRPGDRAPDGPWQGTTLFRKLTGLNHDLLIFGRPDESAKRAIEALPGLRLHIVPADEAPVLHQRYGITKPAMYLIRPDGYIAFRSQGLAPEPLSEFLKSVYG